MKRSEEFVHQAVELGLLEIDAQGRIWRIARQQTSRWGHGTKIVRCRRRRAEIKCSNGYTQIRFRLDGVEGIASGHRLVWFHFRGPIPGDKTINHKDGKKRNNHPDNLELASNSEQTLHAIRVLGFQPWKNMAGKNSQPGELNAQAKLTSRAVRFIRASRQKGVVLAAKYNVRTSTISRVRSGQMWRHLEGGQ